LNVGPAAISGEIFELALVGIGILLLWRMVWSPAARARRAPAALAPWPGSSSDILLLLLLAIAGGTVLPAVVGFAVRNVVLDSEHRLVLGAAAFQGGLLAGLVLFHFLWARGPGRESPPILRALGEGAATLLAALPLVYGVSLVWQCILGFFGLPVEKQDVVALFMGIHSSSLRVVFILIAAVLAPVTEELLFRAGLFRYFRGRVPRWIALGVPALLFGGSHLLQSPLESLAVFAPLVMLGVVFSIAYERTGRIATTMIAHSLFNLNTILLVLLGLNT
jgi:membrane protease YdiL (CAAX protease family)